MKFLYFKITGKKLLVLFFVLLSFLMVLVDFTNSTVISATRYYTNDDRVSYIKQLGYSIDEETAITKDIIIPTQFSDVYNRYNELQKEAGFDLSLYKGQPATTYEYKIANQQEPTYITLIISEGQLIGGDIHQTALGGEMKPLRKK